MTTPIDTDYYAKRIAQEERLASQATDPVARRVHAELAERYAEMVRPIAA